MSTATDADDEKLHDLFEYFCTVSELVYSFGTLRTLVRLHDEDVDDRRKCKLEKVMVDEEDVCKEDNCDDEEKKRSLVRLFGRDKVQVEFDNPELIITDKGSIKKMNINRNLLYPVTPAAIKLFLDNNRKYFVDANDGYGTLEFNPDWNDFGKPVQGWFGRTHVNENDAKDLSFQNIAEEGMKMNQKIIEYDDTFITSDGGGLTHGVIVNKTNKWISVVFRGTYALSEWKVNFNYLFTDDGNYGKGALTHEGFTGFLMGERGCDAKSRSYLERIIASINDKYEKHPDVTSDYKLFISGHSLGGALATMTAFHLAHLKEKNDDSVRNFPKKIRAVTFAAPLAGNVEYSDHYERLEKNGYLRHIRFTNEGDVVPTQPTLFGIEKIAISGDPTKYKQNGVNLNLVNNAKAQTEIVHGSAGTKSTISQLSPWSGSYHSLPEFQKRWNEPSNEASRQLTVKELYEKSGFIFNNIV
mmetsp:Transcript_16389/g.18100  ORF Transcript_16389/g.18100 Transcript_16389/m.18100 type:complete len:470 (-) Transcript_16389:86-1495(-)